MTDTYPLPFICVGFSHFIFTLYFIIKTYFFIKNTMTMLCYHSSETLVSFEHLQSHSLPVLAVVGLMLYLVIPTSLLCCAECYDGHGLMNVITLINGHRIITEFKLPLLNLYNKWKIQTTPYSRLHFSTSAILTNGFIIWKFTGAS